MKINTLYLITTAIKIHEQELHKEFTAYKFEILNSSFYIDSKCINGCYVNCNYVIRVENEDVEIFNTSVWFDEDGLITDII